MIMNATAFLHSMLVPEIVQSRVIRRYRQFRCRAQHRTNEEQAQSPRSKDLGPFKDVSVVGCGTWSWGNRFLFGYDTSQDEELQLAFNEAVARGCNFFDTGDSYGTGNLNARAEYLLGKFCAECPLDISKVVIASKAASYPWRITRSSIADAVSRSAERLNRPVDLAQIHWSTVSYAPWQEKVLWDGIADALAKGDCRAVGVGSWSSCFPFRRTF
jgi:pyridoxine 4-dehydrogenase